MMKCYRLWKNQRKSVISRQGLFKCFNNKVTAYEVVQRLVAKEATSGLERLWGKGRLDLSMEALIAKPAYKDLFSKEILDICNKKLKKYGYKH